MADIWHLKRGSYRAMSECSKYQLLRQTDYVRLREKYDHSYIYSHILSYIALRESSRLVCETKDACPVESDSNCLTTAVRALNGTNILTFNSRNPSSFCQPMFRRQ
jgi:hypothetical protein